MSISVSWIEELLWPRAERRDIWMILDGARDRGIFPMLLGSHLNYSCLYSQIRPALEMAAPYLVQLEYQDSDSRRILKRAWGNSWGVLLKCDLGVDRLRRHLRHFLVVRGAKGERLVFRYYDPRVLRVYLPSCASEELRTVFGPIQSFWAEDGNPEDIVEFAYDGANMVRRAIPLDPQRRSKIQPPTSSRSMSAARFADVVYMPLSIRPRQMAIFSQVEQQKFEAWVLVHLKRFFPRQCGASSDAQLQDMVHYGIERATAHRITSKSDVCRYIDLMIVFGRDFDTDKLTRWAGQILAYKWHSRHRMQALLRAAKQRLKKR